MGYFEKLGAKRCKLPFALGQNLPEATDEQNNEFGSEYFDCECGARQGGHWVHGEFMPVPHTSLKSTEPQRKKYPVSKRGPR